MKSSDSRTNSKYKSPYGCRTNSHCEKKKGVCLVLGKGRVEGIPEATFHKASYSPTPGLLQAFLAC